MSSLREQHERAVGDEFVRWYNSRNGTGFTFAGRGADPPDLVYRDGLAVLPLEITSSYYDSKDATLRWGIARRKPAESYSWQGVNPDQKLISEVQDVVKAKCVSQHDPGTCLVVAIYPSVTTAEELDELLPGLAIPAENPFAGIYLIGDCGVSSSGGRTGYQVWMLDS